MKRILLTNCISFLLLLTVSSISCVIKPRGVPLSKLHFYKENEVFSCLDGSGQLPWTKVNDDYCDCRDASDEPGTSACSNGFFFCENKNFRALLIPSSRVNDGICDCCDGTDEFSGLVNCKSVCWELGKTAREEADKKRVLMEDGHKIYQEYVKQVTEKMTSRKARQESLANEIAPLVEQRNVAENNKKVAEEAEQKAKAIVEEQWKELDEIEKAKKEAREINDAFVELDTNKDGFVSVGEMQVHSEFDIDNSGDVSPEEVKEYLDDQEQVNEAFFKETMWKSIKDIYKPLGEAGHTEDDESEDESIASKILDKKKEEDSPPKRDYDAETLALIDVANKARDEFNEIEEKYRKLTDEKKDTESLLAGDYGPQSAFFVLAESSECFEMKDREYTYKLCPFREASQVGSSGSPSLGTWGKWAGPEDDKYSIMLYENGQSCWNGPNRSAKVHIYCGSTNELTNVSEPSRCEYNFDFHTPAACTKTPEQLQQHDEF